MNTDIAKMLKRQINISPGDTVKTTPQYAEAYNGSIKQGLVVKVCGKSDIVTFLCDGGKASIASSWLMVVEAPNVLGDPLITREKLLVQMQDLKDSDAENYSRLLGALGLIDRSDGFRELGESYKERYHLFVALMQTHPTLSWWSRLCADGTAVRGQITVGMELPTGNIMYGVPVSIIPLLSPTQEIERSKLRRTSSGGGAVEHLAAWIMPRHIPYATRSES